MKFSASLRQPKWLQSVQNQQFPLYAYSKEKFRENNLHFNYANMYVVDFTKKF